MLERRIAFLERSPDIDILNRKYVYQDLVVRGRLIINGAHLIVGEGDPHGSLAAPQGSFFMRTDGGANSSHYSKYTAATSTSWDALT